MVVKCEHRRGYGRIVEDSRGYGWYRTGCSIGNRDDHCPGCPDYVPNDETTEDEIERLLQPQYANRDYVIERVPDRIETQEDNTRQQYQARVMLRHAIYEARMLLSTLERTEAVDEIMGILGLALQTEHDILTGD